MPDKTGSDLQSHWNDELNRYNKAARQWKKWAKKFTDRYRLEENVESLSQTATSRKPTVNILWSNIQTLKPALFSRTPEIVAERRFKDRDPVGRLAAESLQRASNEEIETNHYKESMDACALDLLLVARGASWVRFDDDERCMIDYVHWDDFAHSPERKWEDVERRGWVARRAALTRDEGQRKFGEMFFEVPLTMSARMPMEGGNLKQGNEAMYAEVWEVWDRPSMKRIFIAPAYKSDVLRLVEGGEDNPYQLEKFFPCPRPAYGALSNEDLFPTPDPAQWIYLAEELDRISWRIRSLTESLKLAGAYDASADGLGNLLGATDGKMIAVNNMASIIGKSATAGGGLNGVLVWLPIDQVIQTLLGLYQARDQVKQLLYEISGVSDIVRGQVDPREKATQSKIKAQFATGRLDMRRREMERLARDTARIQVEIMSELYSPIVLREKSGFDFMPGMENIDPQQREMAWQQVSGLLQNDKARGFRIDVETDSTVEMDAGQQQEARTEFLQSAGNFLNNALPVMQAAPQLIPLMGEMLLFTVRGYRAGRTLETTFEEAMQAIMQEQEQQAQQGPPPDPEAEAKAAQVQQKMQAEGAKAQADLQMKQQQASHEGQMNQMEAAEKAAELQQKIAELEAMTRMLQLEIQKMQTDNQRADVQLKSARQQAMQRRVQ